MAPPTAQLGGVTPRPDRHSHVLLYTSSPWRLLIADVGTFLHLLPSIYEIVWPPWPNTPHDYDELNRKDWRNVWALVVHGLLIVFQLAFCIGVIVALFFPIWPAAVVAGVWLWIYINDWVCARTLNSAKPTQVSTKGLGHDEKGKAIDTHPDEKWIFINGVAVGEHWMQANIDLLSIIFQRKIRGIRNRTQGILFDVIEVIIERTLDYCTTDVRNAYDELAMALRNENKKKVVLILHSQGGVQGGLVVDWLLDQCSLEELAKLEVYTFGCAANHFNNPSALHHVEHYANTNDFVARWGILNSIHPLHAARSSKWMQWEALMAKMTWRGSSQIRRKKKPTKEDARSGYQGLIFELPRRGHLLNQHYLSHLFPLEKNEEAKKWHVKTDGSDALMDMRMRFVNQGLESALERKDSLEAQDTKDVIRVSDAALPFRPFEWHCEKHPNAGQAPTFQTPVEQVDRERDLRFTAGPSSRPGASTSEFGRQEPRRVDTAPPGLLIDTESAGRHAATGLKLKEMSRLWEYINGGSPAESPEESRSRRRAL